MRFKNRRVLSSPDKSDSDFQLSSVPDQSINESMQGVLDLLEVAIIIFDQSGRAVYRNKAGARFDQARHSDAVVKDSINRMVAATLIGGAPEEELELLGPPAQVWSLSCEALRSDSQPQGVVVAVQDVTSLRRVEKVRRDFVANVTHELKTPIGALAILAETIATGDKGADTQELAERLVRESNRLGRMVDDLLDLSTIELQDAKDHRSIAVGVLVEEALGRVSALARQRQVALDFVSRGEEAISLLCDQAQMVNALTNLLENAIKYSDSGQLVTITAYRGDSRGGVVVEVSDDGAGIPDQDQERIFERFYRVDKARSRSTGGTGLGLSIVRHVVEAHGGTIVVESEEGEGSVFRLTLPNSSDVIEEENL